jgi:hypothetical protein
MPNAPTKSNIDRLMAYQRQASTLQAFRERLSEHLRASYASDPDWGDQTDDESAPPTLRDGEAPQGCNEVACKHWGRCDRVLHGDCFELRAEAQHDLDVLQQYAALRNGTSTVSDLELR